MIASWNRFHQHPFEWSPGALRRYADFAVSRQVLLARSGRCYMGVGSDTFYAVRSHPLDPPPSRILFLPGIEPGLSFASLAWLNGHFDESRVRFAGMRKIIPEVAWLDVLEAQTLLDGGNPRRALILLRLAEQSGFEDDVSLLTHAVAAGRLGLSGEAEAFIARARRACPLMEDQIRGARVGAGLPPDSPTFKRVK